jgi:hypothetical protein
MTSSGTEMTYLRITKYTDQAKVYEEMQTSFVPGIKKGETV